MMYGIRGRSTGQLLTYQGKAILHDNRGEMEFLFPAENVVRADGFADGSFIPLKDHPDMIPVRWPLRKEDFR